MVSPTSRLSLAPDVQSGSRLAGGRTQTKERPRSSPSVRCTGCGAGPTHNSSEGADMTKRTRPTGLSDSGTPATAVKITPARERGPVTTTPTVA